MFNLLNKEFTFDVDVSTLECGLNGALYFVIYFNTHCKFAIVFNIYIASII